MGWDNATDGSNSVMPIEHELTLHLERAHELAERAKRSNGAVQQQIDRAREIANALYEEFHPSSSTHKHR